MTNANLRQKVGDLRQMLIYDKKCVIYDNANLQQKCVFYSNAKLCHKWAIFD